MSILYIYGCPRPVLLDIDPVGPGKALFEPVSIIAVLVGFTEARVGDRLAYLTICVVIGVAGLLAHGPSLADQAVVAVVGKLGSLVLGVGQGDQVVTVKERTTKKGG
jgi:hypothetical protein